MEVILLNGDVRCSFSIFFIFFKSTFFEGVHCKKCVSSFSPDSIDVGYIFLNWLYVNRCAVEVLEDSGLKKNQVDEIVLVGGSTRIPKVQQLIKVGGNPGRPKYPRKFKIGYLDTPKSYCIFFLNCVCSSI